MSNIDYVNALITAINFDRFADIEARHNPGATFYSFRGPTLHDAVAIADWHREFLRDYADCNYKDLEYIEDGDTVAVRATIEAKGTDWRLFEQRVVEVFRFLDGGIEERRLYAMVPDIELDKPATAAMTNATGYRGGNASTTKSAVSGFYTALLAGNKDEALGFLDAKAVLIDPLYGIASGAENIFDLFQATPRPLFGIWRATSVLAGAKDALVQLAIDPNRPRRADWVRIVDGKIMVIEAYWMFREIGVDPFMERRAKHQRQVILPT